MSPDRERPRGLLVAVVGPSGAGKDTLLRLAFERLGGTTRIGLARRVVTREADGGPEDHETLGATAFAEAEAAGRFCLTWRAHGLAYGLPASVAARIEAGDCVVANLSRRSLAEAVRRFGRVAVVEITARPELLMRRIAARGRETPDEIAARLSRQVPLVVPAKAIGPIRIENVATPAEGAAVLLRHLERLAASRLDDADPAPDPA